MSVEIYSWKPGDADTEVEALHKEVARLRRKIEQLEKAATYASWERNPDRMGGSFTQEEIDNATAWR